MSNAFLMTRPPTVAFPSMVRAALALTLLLALSACSTTSDYTIDELADEINATLWNREPIILPGDKLAVRFPEGERWTQEEVVVGPDGLASFLQIDEVLVAGKTTRQIDAALTEAYRSVLTIKPILSVEVIERTRRTSFSVVGEVESPGVQELPPEGLISLMEAITFAGGAHKATANLGNVLLVRWDPDTQIQRTWEIDMRLKHWGAKKRIFMQPYDVVYLPNRRIDKIGIWLDQYIRNMIPFPRLFVI